MLGCWELCFCAVSDKPQKNLPMACPSCGDVLPPSHTEVPFILCLKTKQTKTQTKQQQKTKPNQNPNKPMCLLLPGQNVISVITPTSAQHRPAQGFQLDPLQQLLLLTCGLLKPNIQGLTEQTLFTQDH